jgi:protein-tyrosine-phosphatase
MSYVRPTLLFVCVHNAGRTSSSPWGVVTPARSFRGKRYEDWQLDDPAGRDIDAVRPIRDAIRARVEKLLTELGVPA